MFHASVSVATVYVWLESVASTEFCQGDVLIEGSKKGKADPFNSNFKLGIGTLMVGLAPQKGKVRASRQIVCHQRVVCL